MNVETNSKPCRIVVPDGNMGNCLDPELPGTGLRTKAGQGEGEAMAGLRRLLRLEKISWNPTEWRKHDGRQQEIYSGCDAEGSAANRVRILSIHSK
jgi:hypothetical protein